MTLHYDHPFKIYHATVPGFGWDESYLEGFNLLRSLVLTWDFFFTTAPTNDNNNEPDPARIRYQLRRTDVDYQTSDHSLAHVDIEAFHPFPPYAMTVDQKLAELEKIRVCCETVRACWPHRRLAYYSCTPHHDWYAITNWLAVRGNPGHPSYANYKSVYLDWRANSRLARFGGLRGARSLDSFLNYTDVISPAAYLPKNTTYAGGPTWKSHPDCLAWLQWYREQTREAKHYRKACIPWIQFHKPETSTFLSTDWVIATLDNALRDHEQTRNTDGVVIYLPTGGQSSDYISTVAQWVEDNLFS